MDNTERNKGFSAIVRKFPVGPVSMVSPFNFPCASPPELGTPDPLPRMAVLLACTASFAGIQVAH